MAYPNQNKKQSHQFQTAGWVGLSLLWLELLQCSPSPRSCTVGEGGATCLRPVESNAGVRDHDRAAGKVPEGGDRQTETDTHTHTHAHNLSIIWDLALLISHHSNITSVTTQSTNTEHTFSKAMRGSTAPLARRVSRQTALPPARLPIAHAHSFCIVNTQNLSATVHSFAETMRN